MKGILSERTELRQTEKGAGEGALFDLPRQRFSSTRIRHQDRLVGFTPQKLRVLAACSGSRLTESFDRSPFPGNSFDPERAGRRGLDTLRSHAAYLGGLCRKRGGLYHEGNIRSAGLLTAAGPRFRTCVYTIVVLTSRCPSSS